MAAQFVQSRLATVVTTANETQIFGPGPELFSLAAIAQSQLVATMQPVMQAETGRPYEVPNDCCICKEAVMPDASLLGASPEHFMINDCLHCLHIRCFLRWMVRDHGKVGAFLTCPVEGCTTSAKPFLSATKIVVPALQAVKLAQTQLGIFTHSWSPAPAVPADEPANLP